MVTLATSIITSKQRPAKYSNCYETTLRSKQQHRRMEKSAVTIQPVPNYGSITLKLKEKIDNGEN
jgi:hypothetical protein